MHQRNIGLSVALLLTLFCQVAWGKTCAVQSPDGRLVLTVRDLPRLSYCLVDGTDTLLTWSDIDLRLQRADGSQAVAKIKAARSRKINEQVQAPLYRQAAFTYVANELCVELQDGRSVIFQLSAEGAAYRWQVPAKGKYNMVDGKWCVLSEQADFNFAADNKAWLSYTTNKEKPLAMAFQNTYDVKPLSQAQALPAFLPATVDCAVAKLTITESDLESYPGMFVTAGKGQLSGLFAPYPTKTDFYAWRHQEYVTQTADYIALVNPGQKLPWRVMAVSHDDTQMPVNNLVYALASPQRIEDTSWIKGGKVAWDWWNDWNLKGVPFRSGINMDTYKYYIDFAASQGIEYIVLDEGWYEPKSGDMLTVIPDLDLPALVAYAKERHVGIILWTVFNVLDSQLEAACSRYAALGIKGFKVDFLDRDDQTAVQMVYRIADACARHHLTLDLHGYYKPTGLSRPYPNIINYEAVFGMEEMKWSPKEVDMPLYDVTFPFIRLIGGPVDYTPGAMRNATRQDWSASYSTPMSQGTRCHQLATYVVYDSPLTMLADAPTSYQQEPAYTAFLCSLPNTCLQTLVPQGKLGEYIVTARKHSDSLWTIGGMTNWTARDIELAFDFLPAGANFQATLYRDGVNSDRNAEDYAVEQLSVNHGSRVKVHMAPGGGFAMRLTLR